MEQKVELHVNRQLPIGYYLTPQEEEAKGISFFVEIDDDEIFISFENSSFVPVLVITDPFFQMLNVELGPQHKELIITIEGHLSGEISNIAVLSKTAVTLKLDNMQELYISDLAGKFSEIIPSNPESLTIGSLRTSMDRMQLLQSIFERCLDVFLSLNDDDCQYLFLEHFPRRMYITSSLSVLYVLSTYSYFMTPDTNSVADVILDYTYAKFIRKEDAKYLSVTLMKRPYIEVKECFVLSSGVSQEDILKVSEAHKLLNDLRCKNGSTVLPNLELDLDDEFFYPDKPKKGEIEEDEDSDIDLMDAIVNISNFNIGKKKQVEEGEKEYIGAYLEDLIRGQKRKRGCDSDEEEDPEHQQIRDGPNKKSNLMKDSTFGPIDKKEEKQVCAYHFEFTRERKRKRVHDIEYSFDEPEHKKQNSSSTSDNNNNNTNVNVQPPEFDDKMETKDDSKQF
jgi:hypothetical protein